MSVETQTCISSVKTIYQAKYGVPELFVKSPGRINLIGEHTDYNLGFVLPAAIDKAIYIAIGKRNDSEIHLTAIDLNESFSVSINDLVKSPLGWPNYIMGIVDQIKKLGLLIGGFNAVLAGDVPLGAGLSSSAAVECATVYSLNELFGLGLSKLEMVKLAQRAENQFVGLQCGIMDMFASMFGRADAVIQLDCRSLEYHYSPFDQDGIKIVLLDTCVKHSLASSEYNVRRKECEAGVAFLKTIHPEVASLRDVDFVMLEELKDKVDLKVYHRCKFIVEEIKRLQDACMDLDKKNMTAFGRKMYETHEGLSKLYEVSCKELDFLASFSKKNENVLGARMMGGGFGGCTINLVRDHAVASFIAQAEIAFQKEFKTSLKSYIVSIGDGTSVISIA
ncbi:MAG: galactokinase [Chitinophagaceae bacterium]|nr:galactokinase [Chitinophagaceae bacterium]